MNPSPPPEPIATYRIQLRNGFDFAQAATVVPYLAALGISHCYVSPYLQAGAGSTHGYDVVDPTRVDVSLGGETGRRLFVQALQSSGLRQMIDLVPNHMAIGDPGNRWWWDVLARGPDSRYAGYFDVDWRAEGPYPKKVMLPVLGDHYGRVLENGEFKLVRNRGSIELHYHDHRFPVTMASTAEMLLRAANATGSALLGFLADCCARPDRPAAQGDLESRDAVVRQLLDRLCRQNPAANSAFDAQLARINADPDALDTLIQHQHYRLAYWRSAAGELGYRRFFDINTLIGVRVERPEVFAATHRLPLQWVGNGEVHGLRIDHPDGLWDPTGYFQQLQTACPEAWIVAEKILEPGEALPPQWPIAGTTGYDFLNRAAGLFVDLAGLCALTDIHVGFTGQTVAFPDLVRQCKQLVLDQLFDSELERLTTLLVAICRQHRRHRDYTRRELRAALGEIAVGFPVYRSYGRIDASLRGPTNLGVDSAPDTDPVHRAVSLAKTNRPDLDPALFAFLEDLLLLRKEGVREEQLAMRFQQLTGPVMAKGVEDTAFYRYHRLIACNEVGADPDRYPVTPDQFHQAAIATLARHPHTLLATTTHDTKRSEDVRARLALLSEMPDQWAVAVTRWKSRNQHHRRNAAPEAATEYLFYQTLVGAWPIDAERMIAYLEKAVREAKTHTNWIRPDTAYEAAVEHFVGSVLSDVDFRKDVGTFVSPLVLPGRINSLAQTLLKLTSPGVPDIYQGTELWDMSLVDPDNRRPVDYRLRLRLLEALDGSSVEDIMARMDEGLPKLWLIHQVLSLRRNRPDLFGPRGHYQPITAAGPKADHVVAYLRGDRSLSIVPRLILGIDGVWAGTTLTLPPAPWRNILTGEKISGGSVPMEVLLERFPVALLVKEE
jgi:(1->4)-alpha-D-glucan 1-alpha-D-glucosylmutase